MWHVVRMLLVGQRLCLSDKPARSSLVSSQRSRCDIHNADRKLYSYSGCFGQKDWHERVHVPNLWVQRL